MHSNKDRTQPKIKIYFLKSSLMLRNIHLVILSEILEKANLIYRNRKQTDGFLGAGVRSGVGSRG